MPSTNKSSTPIPTDNLELLKQIALALKNPNLSNEDLRTTLADYEGVMQNLIAVDWMNKDNEINLKFDNGIAISPSAAAKCLTDFNRTKVFIRGIFNAIEKLRLAGKKQVHIFYAGTGPYATLLLPVMASYDSSFLKCSLLEINEISFAQVQEVINNLGFQDYVKEFIIADATNYQFQSDSEIDILLSETMANGLRYEQQVPILLNLIPQLKESVILIPQNIKLTLAFMKHLMYHPITEDSQEEDYCQRLTTLLETSSAHIRNFSQQMDIATDWNFPEQKIIISLDNIKDFHNLVVLTDIEVFGSDRLEIFESVLTQPVSVTEFDNINHNQEFTIRYKIDEDPGYIFEMRDA